jgi:exosome complex component RRP42
MAASTQNVLLSPAELAFLHTSLSLNPSIRPDGRSATQFRPLVAETGVLPGANGSARVCFADGTEAIVGVKAEVERTRLSPFDSSIFGSKGKDSSEEEEGEVDDDDDDDARKGDDDWVEITVEIPGLRDDDASTVFLAAMLAEALLADGTFAKRLWINRRFHWKVYLDVRRLIASEGTAGPC